MVYVLSQNGQPLMPIRRHGKVRRLLNSKKAKVVRREPFTIQLLFDTENNLSELTLGVDTGSSRIGCAVVTANEEVLYLSEVEIRNDISTKMDRRRDYRRARRTRKLRYRKSRFLNRKNSRKSDRFSPTMTSKINSHIREIEFIKSILPIKYLILEIGTFDPHLLIHQEEGTPFNRSWGYQKDSNYGYANAKAACFARDKYICQCCKTKKGTLNAYHIIYRRNGGADTPKNLIALCEQCHKKLHKGLLKEFELKLQGQKRGMLKYATQMNSIRIQLLKHYPEAIKTFGYITKENRQFVGLEKKHYNDAVVIATGCLNKPKFLVDVVYNKKHVAKGDYQLTKGSRGEIKIPTGKIHGFRKFDKVEYFGKMYFIKGRKSTGFAVLMDIFNKTTDFGYLPRGFKTPKLSNCKRISARTACLCIKQKYNKEERVIQVLG